MIAGHAPLAFALVAVVAQIFGESRSRALKLGVVAAGFALVPDVDMVYAAVGVLGITSVGIWEAVDAFWSSSKLIHRGLSHSLVMGVPAVAGFAMVTSRRFRKVAVLPLVSIVAVSFLTAGLLGGGIMGLYVAMGVTVAYVGMVLGLGPRAVLATAAVGIGTHPFGDVFTGTPPTFLAPLPVDILTERIVLNPDPTLNLLSIFGLELLCLWAAVAVAADLNGWSIPDRIEWPAAAGAGYGAAALIMPAPTLDVSYHFVFSVLAVGSVGAAPLGRRVTLDRILSAAVTGLAAVTIGGVAYGLVYLAV